MRDLFELVLRNSRIDGAIREWTSDHPLLPDHDDDPEIWRSEIPVPVTAHRVPGERAAVQLVITPWN